MPQALCKVSSDGLATNKLGGKKEEIELEEGEMLILAFASYRDPFPNDSPETGCYRQYAL
jgi:hypothetical protein